MNLFVMADAVSLAEGNIAQWVLRCTRAASSGSESTALLEDMFVNVGDPTGSLWKRVLPDKSKKRGGQNDLSGSRRTHITDEASNDRGGKGFR